MASVPLFLLTVFLLYTSINGLPTLGSYYADETGRRMVHFDRNSGECRLLGDERIVGEILRELAFSGNPANIVKVEELTEIIDWCGRHGREDKRTLASDFPHIIYPGTKWCGTGNAAEGINDLGSLRDLDECCRSHDLCPDTIEPGQSRHNITNDSPFSVVLCSCSEKFRQCLRRVNSMESWEVGMAFFSSGLFQCYDLAKPIAGCVKWAGILNKACQKYDYNESGTPKYQLMDMRSY